MFVLLTQCLVLLTFVWSLKIIFLSKQDVDNIPGPKSESFATGNMAQMFDPSGVGWEFNSMISKRYGRVARIWGPFGSKYLTIHDPKALHYILVKDQAKYEEPSSFSVFTKVMFGDGLLSTQGEQHKKQRKMLNSVFSTAHMCRMMPILNDVARKLGKAMKNELTQGVQEVDVLRWMSRAALEMIGQSGLGYSFDPLEEGTMPHPFCEAAKAIALVTAKMALEIQYLLPILVKVGTPGVRRWFVDHFPSKKLRAIRDIADTLDQTTMEIFERKKRALMEGDEVLAGQEKDLLSILMKANMEASDEDKLPDKEVLGQMSTLAFAATDTTANALSRALHLLALHTEVQERLRTEIIEARNIHSGEIPYDELVSLPFMDAVCRETLRLHAPIPRVVRVSQQDIALPLLTPIKGIDGREMDSIIIPEDTKIFIDILNANRDPLLWGPDCLEWIPERWLAPLPEALHEAHMPGVHSHLLTFLGGGRACIGFKFSQLEMKVVLATLVSQFRFYPSKKKISWQMSGITIPTVKDAPETPQLPLRLEVVDPQA